jgi:hypothetical protein
MPPVGAVIANAGVVQFLAAASGPLAAVLSALTLWGLPLGGLPLAAKPMAAQELVALPCPSSAGWQVVRQLELPRFNRGGRALGGFSAAIYKSKPDQLWLLSDLAQGSLSIWQLGLAGLAKGKELDRPQPPLRELSLRGGASAALPAEIDSEAMVLLGDQLWVASEGRRSAERPPQLLKFAANTGELLQAIDLPAAWQAAKDSGLASNGGPESLTLLPGRDGRPQLLMAAEQPLLQDPARHRRLLLWSWPRGLEPRRDPPQAREWGSLLLPPEPDWGLTDLLALRSNQLLALLRRFEAPDHWQIRLVLYPLPSSAPAARPARALAQWDLIAGGLAPDNWEGLSFGPRLADGRPSLLLVSDDNLSPFQANRVALLSPRQTNSCSRSR